MKLKNKYISVLLLLLACCSMLLCACVSNEAPDDEVLRSFNGDISAESKAPTEQAVIENEYMKVLDVISITPTNVAVFGQLTERAVSEGISSVRVMGAKSIEVRQACVDSYFLIPVELPGNTKATFSAIAMKGEEEVGEPLPFSAPYDSTAEDRMDGKGVAIGKDSRMYFSKYLDDYLSKSLYTASQMRTIKSTLTNTYKALVNRANGMDVGIIYVLLPDLTTMDPGIMLDEDKAEKNTEIETRYEQIVQVLRGTKVQVVDMKTVLQSQLDAGKDIYDLYRRTDSHPTELTSFLMYQEVMKYLAAVDTDVVPHTLEDYTLQEINALGGDYADYRGLDPSVVRETITVLKPNFDLQEAVAMIKMFTDTANVDYILITTIDASDLVTTGAERTLVTTDRTALPNLLVYRDENAIGASLLLADSCDQTLLARAGDYSISLTDASQYRDKAEGKDVVDYIVVFISESEIGSAFATN